MTYSTATINKIVHDEGPEVASDNGAQVVCDAMFSERLFKKIIPSTRE